MPFSRRRNLEIQVPGYHEMEPSRLQSGSRGCDFTALELERDPATGVLWFNHAPLAEFCRANDQDPERVLGDIDLACCFIALWYCLHRQNGGPPDPVAERVVAEVVARDDAAQSGEEDVGRVH